MININAKAQIDQVIEMTDKETGQIKYLIEKDGQWNPITKEEYDNKMRGR